MKRTYFLVGIAAVQLVVGTYMMYDAAAPVHTAEDVFVGSGGYHHREFGILGQGRMIGNLSELQGRSFDLFVFDDSGYSSFLAGPGNVTPLFAANGTNITFDLDLAGGGQYHVVLVDEPARGELRVRLDFVVAGLKTNPTISALVVLVGGLALVGATLMLSVWAWRRDPSVPKSVAAPPGVPGDAAQDAPQDPPHRSTDDDTRIY